MIRICWGLTASQNEHRVNVFEHTASLGAKQLWRDAFNAFQRVGNGAGLLKNFFLHVVPVRAQFCRAAVGNHRFDFALHGFLCLVQNPVFTELNVNQIAFFKVNDLVCHASQSHRVAGQKILLIGFAHTQNQW